MATGDILSAVVRADGWSMDVTIEGFAVGATYDFGSLDDTPATVTAPMFSVAVVSEGYNAAGVLGTIARTVYGTHVVRKPYSAGGDHLTKQETASGSDLVVRVALSESIYNDDKNGGAGTSGTNPAVTISAAWATNAGGASQASAAATALACTNNSTLDYPKVIAQWAWGHTPAFRRVAAAFDIGCIAYHGHGIACVALSATDAHAAAVSGTATTKTDHTMSASGLHYESYDLAVPVTSFTDGDDITLKFIAYPLVGDADSIIDTSLNTTASDNTKGYTQITCTYKTSVTTKYVATAGATPAGSDANAGTLGAPYLTIGKALDDDADVIYVQAGTYDVLGSTPVSVTARNYAVEIRPYTGESVTLTRGGTHKSYKAKRLAYIGVTISGTSWIDGEAGDRAVIIDSCTFSGVSTVAAFAYRTPSGYFHINCTLGNDIYGGWSDASFTGCVGTFTAVDGMKTYGDSIVACKFGGSNQINRMAFLERASGTTTNLLIAHNVMHSVYVSGNPIVHQGALVPVSGFAFVGNVLEMSVGTQPALRVAADSEVASVDSIVIAHNTITGGRCNLFYNDSGTVANVRTNIFVRNNTFNGFAIKSDTFGTPNAARVGNWAQMNGVNYSDNRYTYQASLSSFTCDWNGINVKYEDTGAAIPNEMGFTDDNSAYGDGTGNGDYMPTEASVLYDHTLRQAYQSYDLYGVAL